jgi:TRAP-type C4-dicarboxylate transport system permease small subunit
MADLPDLAAQARRRLAAVLRFMLGAILTALVCLDATQVVLRYLFLVGVAWGGDVATLLLFALAWLGAPLLWLSRGHISVDFVTALLGSRGRARLNATLDVVMIAGAGVLAAITVEAMEAYSLIDLPTLGTSAAVKYVPIFAGCALLALSGLINLLADRAGAE